MKLLSLLILIASFNLWAQERNPKEEKITEALTNGNKAHVPAGKHMKLKDDFNLKKVVEEFLNAKEKLEPLAKDEEVAPSKDCAEIIDKNNLTGKGYAIYKKGQFHHCISSHEAFLRAYPTEVINDSRYNEKRIPSSTEEKNKKRENQR